RGVWALLPTPRLVSHKCVSHLLLNLSIWDYKTLNDKESRVNMTIYDKPLRKRGFRHTMWVLLSSRPSPRHLPGCDWESS
ncbi:MAG: hypothetical protein ACJZ02_06535, partial [Candidatus Neomarinimicrobiota bacterium]